MGTSFCTTCGVERHQKVVINTDVVHKSWADAVTNNKLAGIKGLHQNDPSLINAHVDTWGCVALHYAIRAKNDQLLLYLLTHKANINAQGGKAYNSALHEAVLINNVKAISYLYEHNIDDTLRNNDNKTAMQLCKKHNKREFIKAKEYGISLQAKGLLLDHKSSRKREETVMFHGANLDQVNNQQIKRILKESDDVQMFFKAKRQEIKTREVAITNWGHECGIEIDEIAMVLIDENPNKIWNKLTKKKKCLSKQTDIFKLLFGMTANALKKRHKQKKPSEESIRKLTKMICKKLPRKKGKAMLEQEMFVKKFHTLLFDLHAEMVEGNEMDVLSSESSMNVFLEK